MKLKQKLELIELLKNEYPKLNVTDKEFAEYASEKLNLPITYKAVRYLRYVIGIQNARMVSKDKVLEIIKENCEKVDMTDIELAEVIKERLDIKLRVQNVAAMRDSLGIKNFKERIAEKVSQYVKENYEQKQLSDMDFAAIAEKDLGITVTSHLVKMARRRNSILPTRYTTNKQPDIIKAETPTVIDGVEETLKRIESKLDKLLALWNT